MSFHNHSTELHRLHRKKSVNMFFYTSIHMQFLFWLGWEKSIDRLSCFPSFWACLSICSLHVDMIEAKGCVRWWYKVCSTYVNDKVPMGNEIHARMHENSLPFLLFLLVFKVHIFWEGRKILRNLPLTFDYSTYSQTNGEDFTKFVVFSGYMNFSKKCQYLHIS